MAERMAEFIFDSEDQNQRLFDDYVRIVQASQFDTLFLKGYAPGLAAKYPSARSPVVLDELRARFGAPEGFLYDGITLLLRKRG